MKGRKTSAREENISVYAYQRVFIARLKASIIEMLEAIGEDPLSWAPYMREIIGVALALYSTKGRLRATLHEVALTALWYTAVKRGAIVMSFNKIFLTIKKRLRRRISKKRILLLLNTLKRVDRELVSRADILRRAVLSTIFKLSMDDEFLSRLSRAQIPKDDYLLKLQRTSLAVLNELLKRSKTSHSMTVLAALAIYIADKIIAKNYGVKRLLPARLLEKHLGVSQFTILRLYKGFMK